ncbi:MAG: mannitol-1-phosphate 5-dehydrogenase [Eubacteriales bacterium]|nr:mannitol-1-phosphate 5-dehydrogenase [Eubacteriales bacterium]
MKAIHFGAGNIGRGFIGLILRQNGYELTFADISDKLIEALQQDGEYDVIIADHTGQKIHVDGVMAIHNIKEAEKLKSLVAEADLITTAVGPTIVPLIAKTILAGIQLKLTQENSRPLNIIACENAVGATAILKSALYDLLTDAEKVKADQVIGFPNSAVDRIVPAQHNENLLDVKVEPFYEWVVDETQLKGELPRLSGVHYVSDLTPLIERKLFTVNTGHAATAYLGLAKGFTTVEQAMSNPAIEQAVRAVLNETSQYITGHYGFDVNEHQDYVDTIIERFKNPYISDDLARVGRSPLRKISKNDRFISPALKLLAMDIEPVNLAQAIAAVLQFTSDQDPESLELHAYLITHGVRATLIKYSGLEENSKLIDLVVTAAN